MLWACLVEHLEYIPAGTHRAEELCISSYSIALGLREGYRATGALSSQPQTQVSANPSTPLLVHQCLSAHSGVISKHKGNPLTTCTPFVEALERVLLLEAVQSLARSIHCKAGYDLQYGPTSAFYFRTVHVPSSVGPGMFTLQLEIPPVNYQC